MSIEKKRLLPMNIQFFAEQEGQQEEVQDEQLEQEQQEEQQEQQEETMEEKFAKLMAENAKLKNANNKLASENADNKKKLREKMSQTERFELEKAEAAAAKETELQDLRRRVEINDKTATLMDLGYSKAQAKKAAEAQIDGDFDTYTQIQKEVIDAKVKAATAKALKDMPTPPTGGSHSAVTKEQFEQMGYGERLKLLSEDPETYNKLNS